MSFRLCSRAPETTIWLPAAIYQPFYDGEQTFVMSTLRLRRSQRRVKSSTRCANAALCIERVQVPASSERRCGALDMRAHVLGVAVRGDVVTAPVRRSVGTRSCDSLAVLS